MKRDGSEMTVVEMRRLRAEGTSVSFAGCGFLGVYHIGVAACILTHAPHLLDRVAGASMGAIVACCIAADVSLGKCKLQNKNLKMQNSLQTKLSTTKNLYM